MADLLTRFKNAEKRLSPRFDRMDEDMLTRYLLENYILTDSKGHKIPHAEHITMNDPRTFADKVIFSLGTLERRFDIQADKVEDATYAELLIKYALDMNDENLIAQGLWPLEESLWWNSVLRGTEVVRVLVKRDGMRYQFEILPFDARSIAYEPGKKGADLVGFRNTLTAPEIKRDYGIEITTEWAEVVDIWTPEQNIIYLEKREKPVMEITHGLGMNPMIVVGIPTSPPIVGIDESVKHENESIYAPVRDLYNVLNKQSSAWATQNMMGFLPPMQFISKDGRKSKVPPFGVMAVMNLRSGEEYKAMPIKDVTTSHQAFYGQIMARIQRGTGFSNFDYGDLSFEISALALKRMEKSKDQTFVPRIRGQKLLMQAISKALFYQFINGGYPCDLGDEGVEIPFKPYQFMKKFKINIDYFSISPEESIADYTIAQTALAMGMPEEYVFKRIVKIEDYEGLKKMRDRERTEKESDTVRRYRYALSLLDTGDEDDEIEARLILAEIGMILQGGGMVNGEPAKNAPSQPKLPLGLTNMPIASRPQPAEAQTQRAENRRQRIYEREEGTSAREGKR